MPISPEERINVDDTAHFLTHYAPLFMKNLLKKVQSNELRPLDRLQLLNEQLLLTRGQIIPSADIIPIIDAYKHETHDDVWGVMSLAIGELKKFVEDDEKAEKQLRKFAGNLARNEYTRLGWEQKQTEPESDTRLRPTIIGLMAYSEDKAVIETAKKLFASTPLDALDPELRPVIISVAVRHTQGTVIVDQLLKEHAATSSAEIQGDIAAGVTSTKNQVAIDLLIEKLTDTNAIRMQDTARWFVYLMRSREAKDKAWTWMCDNWQWIEDTFGGDKSYDDYPRYAAGSLTTRKQLNNYKKFFESKQEIPALNRAINLGIKEIEGRVELIERDGEAVRKILLR